MASTILPTSEPASVQALDPSTGQPTGPALPVDGPEAVAEAARRAAAAFDAYRAIDLGRRAALLDAIAASLEQAGEAIIACARSETGLPQARLTGELGRTCGQLRLFATEIRRGDFLGIRIDPALPGRTPLPRPDLRTRRIPVGPVAVFGASNFPLAFSVAGGDTASALAAGCPVVVRAHPAHPGTSRLVADAVSRTVAACDLPAGVFALVSGPDLALGEALVRDRHIAAVGFTGSRAGGLALSRIAAERPVPIPVFAEMSSINPVFLLPARLAEAPDALADGFVASLSLNAGQFCTNPGVAFAVRGPGLDAFLDRAAAATRAAPSATMLTAGIHAAYEREVAARAGQDGVAQLAAGTLGEGEAQCRAALFRTDATTFLAQHALSDEIFGATSLVVVCDDEPQLLELAERLEGQLTATLQMAPADTALALRLLPVLERRCGRILANGWPTGVEVCDAMVHGGPYPATGDGRTSSVGTLAIERFLRPVCYQNLPAALLPPELADDDALGLPRRVGRAG